MKTGSPEHTKSAAPHLWTLQMQEPEKTLPLDGCAEFVQAAAVVVGEWILATRGPPIYLTCSMARCDGICGMYLRLEPGVGGGHLAQ